MTVFARLLVVLVLVFAGIYGIGAYFFVGQAQLDILRELEGAGRVAQAIGPPESYGDPTVGAFRHLHPVYEGEIVVSDVPVAFTRMVLPDTLPTSSINGWQLDPSDEIKEVWESFAMISAAFLLGLILAVSAVCLTVRQGIRPLRVMGNAMLAVRQGHLGLRLPLPRTQELRVLALHFNEMAESLSAEKRAASELTERLLQVQDEERALVARTLHDDLGQYLTGIRAQALAWSHDEYLPENYRDQALTQSRYCKTLQDHFSHLLQDLHPLVLERLGLAQAIQHLVDEWRQLNRLPCNLKIDQDLPSLGEAAAAHLYRFLQEALTNVARHARASQVRLSVGREAKGLRIEVEDNGQGARNLDDNPGIGLRSMRERARCLHAQLDIATGVGKGVRLSLLIPA